MNPFKMLSLAALSALVVMAFIGASSAMASSTQICNTDPGEGVCSSPVTHVHATSIGKGILLSSAFTAECDVLFLSTSVGALGAPQVLKGNFIYTNCGGCTVEEVNGPSEITILKIAHEIVSLTDQSEIHLNCLINCYYSGKAIEGFGKGPLLSTRENGEASAQGQEMKKVKGTFCPASVFLDLTMVTLSGVYIGA